MKKVLFVLFVVLTQTSICQTIEVKPSLGLVFGGFNTLNERPVRTSILYYPKLLAFDLGYCVDIIYKHHKFNIASSPVGNNFGGILRTIDNNQIEGIFNFSRTINQLLLGYQYYNVIPSKSKRIKFNYAFGLGYGFNSNEFNYQDSMVRYFAGGSAGRGGYFYAFEGEVKRVGGSLYIMPEIGMDLYSKKKKKRFLA